MRISQKAVYGFGVALVLFGFYLLTCSRTVGLVDSGELSGVAWTLGIAHPTGYPLWTLMAFAFSHIFAVGEPVFRVAVMSGLSTALAGSVLFYAMIQMGLARSAAVVGALSFGLARLVWATSVSAEVYGLGGLLVALFLLSLITWERGKTRPFVVWYAGGLVLANHMSGLSVVLPGLVYMIYRDRKTLLYSWAALIALSVYAFLPIRSIHEPFFDWGDPQTLTNFIWHITGNQYRVWMFSRGAAGLWSGLVAVAGALWENWNVAAPLALLGVFLMKTKMRWVVLAGVGLSLVYLSGYSIPDIGDYFVPMFALLALGLAGLLHRARSFAWFGLMLPGALIWFNYKTVNRNGDRFPEDVAVLCMESAEQNGVILCNYWDIVSPMLYLQQVKGVRKDLVIVDKELLRRSWYLKHIRLKHPGLNQHIQEKMNAFSKQLSLFEHGKPYNPEIIQTTFVEMISAMMLDYPGPSYMLLGEIDQDEGQVLQMARYRPTGPFLAPVSKPGAARVSDSLFKRLVRDFNAFPRSARERVLMATLMKNLSRSGSVR